MTVSAIVLAAGASSRMGTNKLLLPWRGSSVIRSVVEMLQMEGLAEVVVVVGNEANPLSSAISDLPCRIVVNPNYREGIGTSIATGVRAASANSHGFLVVLADMVAVDRRTVETCLSSAAENAIVVPQFEGKNGNPVLFGSQFRPELERLDGSEGGRTVLARYPDRIVPVPVTCQGILEDLDTPADYARLAKDPKV